MLHRMLNAIEPGSYIRPHRHQSPPKPESIIVLSGSLALVKFGGDGASDYFRTHSQASSPRWVTLPQLPSPRTFSIGAIIWYTDLLETPSLIQGTCTPQNHARAGRTRTIATERRIGSVLKTTLSGRRRLNRDGSPPIAHSTSWMN
jgi:hypothetical protein